MSRLPRRGLAAVILIACAISVAACGSATTSAGPSSSAVAPVASSSADAGAMATPSTPSAPSAAASAAAGQTADPNATPIPTFTRVADLEALLPKTLLGKPLSVMSMSGTDIVASGRPSDVTSLQAILQATGGQPADYGFGYAFVGDSAVVGVFRVKGADATKIRDSLIEQSKQFTGGAGTVSTATVGGKQVETLSTTTDGSGPVWYYLPKGDVLFYVQTVDPKMAEAFLAGL